MTVQDRGPFLAPVRDALLEALQIRTGKVRDERKDRFKQALIGVFVGCSGYGNC